ncbi:DUF4123 domain-containing protein [Parasulfitobacter algicola]|uniref:DUF4123 domain-containing protein n=1 Tax=Parasulfitobacter algicola TaxID=2614809 RepID=A0ABX2IRV6_9RHOB|nr:DUF4123 domain-containing protein [Sulfitobacter algicola]
MTRITMKVCFKNETIFAAHEFCMTANTPLKDGTYQDPWNEGEQSIPAKTTESTAAPLIIQMIEGLEPLDDQFGLYPPKTVPDALHEPLFGQTDPDTRCHTYAILDAAKVPNLPELLSTSELEHRCLFNGQAEDDLGDVAPWIVKLEDGNTFTRYLFTQDPEDSVPWYLWSKEPGIYIRSTASLDDLWRHFRKFTKFTDHTGKAFFFRFWEPMMANAYLDTVAREADRFRVFYETSTGQTTHSILCCEAWGRAMIYTAKPFKPDPEKRDGFALTQPDLDAFARATRARQIRVIATEQRQNFPDLTKDYGDKDLQRQVAALVNRMQEHGFKKRQNLNILATWELLYGPLFEDKDPEGTLQNLFQSNIPESRKLKQVELRLTELHKKELL